MVHPQEDRNNTLHQFREGEHREQPERQAGRLPYPGEVIGGRAEPPFEVTGLDALSPLLAAVEFPATREEIINLIGEAMIPIDKVTTMRAAELLERAGPSDFRSSTDVEAAVQSVLRKVRPHYEDGRGAHHRQGDNLAGRRPN